MADIPNREELEARFGRAVSRLSKEQLGRLIKHLGDPPKIENVPFSFWEETDKEMLSVISPMVERVYLEAAQRMLADIPIGVDWGLVNERAVEFSRQYTFRLVKEMSTRQQAALQNNVSRYFEQGWTMGDLEASLFQHFASPVRAEMISVTEVTRAATEGERAIANELLAAGIEMVPVWITNNDEIVRECPICWPRHEQQITDGFYPPGHPRCRCWVVHELPKVEGR